MLRDASAGLSDVTVMHGKRGTLHPMQTNMVSDLLVSNLDVVEFLNKWMILQPTN